MNRTFTLCFLLYPIALPFGYVLVYTFYHYAVPDANSDLTLKANGYIVMSNLDLNSIEFGIYLVTNAVNAPDANWWMILSAVNNGTGSQIAKSVTSKTIMVRELIAGNWNSWSSLHA